MFLGSVIYDKRRSLNLTQNDVASGICNQNTISKMEKHNMTPQIEVLIKICRRLDLSLNDVFSDFSGDLKQEQVFVLDDIEKDVLLRNLDNVKDKLPLIEKSINSKDLTQFCLVKGLYSFWQGNLERSSFEFDKVIQITNSDKEDIYTLLAYLMKGMSALQQKHLDMVAYYAKIVADVFQENLSIVNSQGIEIIFICKFLGTMYIGIDHPELAREISQRGIDYANELHISYFLSDLAYNLSLAHQQITDNETEAQKYKNIAYYSAMLLGDADLQEKIESDDNSK